MRKEKKEKGENFYSKKKTAKGIATTKVKEKVTKKKVVLEPFDASSDDVYPVNGINVLRPEGLMPTWVQENARWHINLRHSERDDVFHVSEEGSPMKHYYFTGSGTEIVGVQPSSGERGSNPIKKVDGERVNTKLTFDDLPGAVQTFIKNNWDAILG